MHRERQDSDDVVLRVAETADRDNFLDCIRALAVAMVFGVHFHALMRGGTVGVSAFFCLSGYLIARILLGLPELSMVNIWKFIFRRFMRVWPLMAFQIFLVWVLMTLTHPQLLPGYAPAIPGLLTFTGGYVAWSGLSPAVLWTLRAEFWFYVCFPLALCLFGKNNLVPLIVGGIIVSWIYKLGVGHSGGGSFLKAPIVAGYIARIRLLHFTLMYLDQLMIGVACTVILSKPRAWLTSIRSRVYPVAAIGFMICLAFIPFREYDFAFYAQTTASSLATALLILHQAERPIKCRLEPAALIGRISYSIYLMHAVLIDYLPLDSYFRHLFSTPLMILAIIGASFLTYRLIELPFIALSKRLAPFSRRPDSAVPSA
jgi:peptidoglycan/LPS O-acetylase OafA/YrhL